MNLLQCAAHDLTHPRSFSAGLEPEGYFIMLGMRRLLSRMAALLRYDSAAAHHHRLFIDPRTNLGLPSQRDHPYLELLPAVYRMRHFANGILLMMGKLADTVLHSRFVAFLDASRLSTVGVGRVVFRP